MEVAFGGSILTAGFWLMPNARALASVLAHEHVHFGNSVHLSEAAVQFFFSPRTVLRASSIAQCLSFAATPDIILSIHTSLYSQPDALDKYYRYSYL